MRIETSHVISSVKSLLKMLDKANNNFDYFNTVGLNSPPAGKR